jgi:hypothetical protein
MLKRYGADVGLEANKCSGHSLRAGLVTSAIQAGVNPLDGQRHSGHASLATHNFGGLGRLNWRCIRSSR